MGKYMKSIQLAKTAIAVNAALFLSASFAMPVFADENTAVEKTAIKSKVIKKSANTKNTKKDEIEIIEVTGIRGSLRDNLNNKRFSNSVVDSLNSDDVTKNPDRNAAEALQRISGVQLVSEFGEGVAISIRGTSPDLTNTLVNGQALASAQWLPNAAENNAADFSGLSAQQISKYEVYKSPQANLPSGGIGGTVILHTRTPLETDADSAYVNIEGQYNDGSGEFSPAISGQYNWINEDGNFGAFVNLSYDELSVQRDGFELWSYYPYYTTPGSSAYAGNRPLKPSWLNSTRFTQSREKLNANIALEYQANDNLNIQFNYLGSYADMGNKSEAMLFRGYEAWQVVRGDDTAWNPLTTEVANEDGSVSDVAYLVDFMEINVLDFRNRSNVRNGNPDIWQQTIDRDGTTVDSETFSLKAQYEITNWTIVGEIGRSSAKSHKTDFMNSVFLNREDSPEINGLLDDYTATYNYNNGTPSYGINNDMLINPTKEFAQNEFWDKYVDINNISDYAKFDIQVELDNNIYITSVEFGANYTESTRDRLRMQSDSNIFGTKRRHNQGYTVDTFVNGTVSGVDAGAAFGPSEFFSMDSALAKQMFNELPVVDDLSTCDDLSVQYCRSNYKQWGTSYDLTKENLEAYMMINFGGERWHGNLGGRFISSDTTRDVLRPDGEMAPPQTGDYSDFTPSFNFSYDITDNFLMRIAASKTISQPTFSKTVSDVVITSTGAINKATAGNPDLDPFESDQIELGYEWYFTDASLFSATAYYKEISNWIVDTTIPLYINVEDPSGGTEQVQFLLTVPVNAEGTQYMSGIEVQLQHDFDNGFGFTANYNYTDVPSITVDTVDYQLDPEGDIELGDETYSAVQVEKEIVMKGNSRHTANVSAYYEDANFSARLSYNYRSEYVVSENLSNNMIKMKKAKGTLDLKTTYNITDDLLISASIMNLTDELDEQFFRMTSENAGEGTDNYHPEYVGDYYGRTYKTGRRIFVGVNYTF